MRCSRRFLSLLLPAALAAAGLCSCQPSPERELEKKIQGYDAAERCTPTRRTGTTDTPCGGGSGDHAYSFLRSVYEKVDECLPLTREEVKAVREILAEIEETPVHDKKLWLDMEYDSYFGP